MNKIRLVIWGAGKNLQLVYDSVDFNRAQIVGIVDSNIDKQNVLWNEITIYNPTIIQKLDYDYIIISPLRYEEIVKECQRLGVEAERIISFWNNKNQYIFLKDYPKENYWLKRENEKLRLKLENNRFELGLEPTPIIQEPCEVLKKMLLDKSSLCRFGDGEFEMIRMNDRPWFQQIDEKLSKKLMQVLNSNDEKINIAIADLYGSLSRYTEDAALGMRRYMDLETRKAHMQLLSFSRVYFDTYVTRPYLIYQDKKACEDIFRLWKEIFKGRHLLIVEGINSRFGVNNDLLSNALSIRRILCPARNAFRVYESIKETVLNNVRKDDLVLITLGPTATVLAYDIAREGYQAIDIGQIDNEYDWYLRNAERQIPIRGKCVAEAANGRIPKDDIDLSQYRKECVATVEGEITHRNC